MCDVIARCWIHVHAYTRRARVGAVGVGCVQFHDAFRSLLPHEAAAAAAAAALQGGPNLQGGFEDSLLLALEKRAGTGEQIAALSVATCRALGLTTRYVAILDVAPLKPDAESLQASHGWDEDEGGGGGDSGRGRHLAPHLTAVAPPSASAATLGQVFARSLSQSLQAAVPGGSISAAQIGDPSAGPSGHTQEDSQSMGGSILSGHPRGGRSRGR
eukprot:jgi/Mesen1/5827/ME000297S05030